MMKNLLIVIIILLLAGCSSDDVPLLETPSTEMHNIRSVSLNLDYVSTETTWDVPSASTRATSTTPPTRIALRIFGEDSTSVLGQINQ